MTCLYPKYVNNPMGRAAPSVNFDIKLFVGVLLFCFVVFFSL